MLVSSAYPQWLVRLFTPFSMHTCHFISAYLCPQDKSPGVELLGQGAGGLQRAAEVATLCPSACVPVGSWLTLTSERPGRAAPSLTLWPPARPLRRLAHPAWHSRQVLSAPGSKLWEELPVTLRNPDTQHGH